MREESNTVVDKIRTATLWTGVLLIAAGVIALLGLATVAVNIIRDPEGVALVKWLTEKVGERELFMNGYFDQIQFAINASPALEYIFLGLIGLLLINIFATIVRTLISFGAQLIQFAGIQKPDTAAKGKPYAR